MYKEIINELKNLEFEGLDQFDLITKVQEILKDEDLLRHSGFQLSYNTDGKLELIVIIFASSIDESEGSVIPYVITINEVTGEVTGYNVGDWVNELNDRESSEMSDMERYFHEMAYTRY